MSIQPGQKAGSYVQPGFERFDQKNNLIYLGDWNPDFGGLTFEEQKSNRTKLMERGVPGYGPLDWALYMATTTNIAATSFEINTSDVGGTSWSAIPRSESGLEVRHGAFPEWDGSAVQNTAIVKNIAKLLGAGDVGICELDRQFVYSRYYDRSKKTSFPICFSDEPGYEQFTAPTSLPDGVKVIPASMKYAIVMIFPMERAGVMTAPVLTHSATTFLSYSQISYTTMAMAEFLRGLGRHAIPSSNDLALNVPLAIDAGLGEPTRNDKIAHPVYGTCCRIAKVITDLPLEADSPITFGVVEKCKSCGVCAERCPSGAISKDADMSVHPRGLYSHQKVRQWPMEHDKCRRQWVKVGTNCGVCIASCPLNQPFKCTPGEYWGN
ncbi:hypothetical protein AGMMS49983_20970 [Clostridia bacterium]|nr:hypothetical protein AGMMS49983_20970 [Clostridia bacterium]